MKRKISFKEMVKGIGNLKAGTLIVLIILAGLISYFTLNDRLITVFDIYKPRYTMIIQVLNTINPEAIPNREVWINRIHLDGNEDLKKIFHESISTGFEYRSAEEFGYSNDVITCSGGEGSRIQFSWVSDANNLIEFWRQNLSGTIQISVTYDTIEISTTTIDLFSNKADDFYTVMLPAQPYASLKYDIYRFCIEGLAAVVITMLFTLFVSRFILVNSDRE